MAEAWPRTAPRPTATTPEFLATFGLILAAILAFGAFDVWLARVDERAEGGPAEERSGG
jgi:hypothetical protein